MLGDRLSEVERTEEVADWLSGVVRDGSWEIG